MKLERQAVVLAGGRGSRLEPFNRTTPKPLIKIAGKPIIEYNMQSLLPHTDGFVIVVGYLHEQIEGYFGDNYQGKPISYVFQGDPQGTGHSLKLARESVESDRTIVIYGDDIYDPKMFAMLPESESAIVGKKFQDWQQFGVIVVDEQSRLQRLEEKPKSFVSDLVNVGVYQVSRDFWGYLDGMKLSVRGEYELTEAIENFGKDHFVKCYFRVGIGFLWDILGKY